MGLGTRRASIAAEATVPSAGRLTLTMVEGEAIARGLGAGVGTTIIAGRGDTLVITERTTAGGFWTTPPGRTSATAWLTSWRI